jgi:hypothetical protein
MEAPDPIYRPQIIDLATWRRPDVGDAPGVIEREIEPEVEPEIEREIEEVTTAILLVADLRQTRVLVGNLAHGADVADAVAYVADEVEVDLELIERRDGRGCDIAVRGR